MTTSARGFVTTSAVLFSLVAAFQLWRAISGWPVEINHFPVPVAASWGIAALAGLLATWGWRSR